ncbi:hypothetical protein ACH5RR_030755 [Cinchona calisaya]|uniref:Coilin n=1 Tax=Cinchona calisaya TaxID=153742 RepID=A0ABD2YWU7_9GENT
METTRLRLEFKDEEGILSQSQKSEGLKRCWILLKPHIHKTIADVTTYILHAFQLHPSCPHGLILYMDGFVLPPFESTTILKDKDVIRVRKKGMTLAVEGKDPINLIEELEAVEKQPVNTGALLLANEEFEKETGGYQSDEPQDESEQEDEKEVAGDSSEEEDEQLEDTLHNSSQGIATSKKRKALEKLRGSKKKKQRTEEQGSIENAVPADQIEKSPQDGVLAAEGSIHKQEKASKLKRKNKSENAEPGPGNVATSPNIKSSDNQTQKNGEEIKEASGGTKKLPSRSARRKKAKRRWIREMAKIQKRDGISQPNEFQNWKKKPARAERKKYNNWKHNPANLDGKEDDGQPKGLLYLKQWSGKDASNNKRKPEEANQNGSVSEQSNQKKSLDNEVVPVVIRPGHIRFEPSENDQAVKQNQVLKEPFRWNGITSKRKGQKWGSEKKSFGRRNDYRDDNREHPVILSVPKEIHLNGPIDFEKLPLLCDMPKAGDVIGYRLLELSSTWTPELSPFRVGHVAWCSSKTTKLILMPVPGYPVISKNSDEEPDQQPDNSLYKEDGSLEIDFTALIDVRVVKDGNEGPAETGEPNEAPAATENATLSEQPGNNKKQTDATAPGTRELNRGKQINTSGTENGGNIWEQLSEALNAKKEELSQGNSWDKASSGKSSWSYRALKGSALGPTMALLRSKDN